MLLVYIQINKFVCSRQNDQSGYQVLKAKQKNGNIYLSDDNFINRFYFG